MGSGPRTARPWSTRRAPSTTDLRVLPDTNVLVSAFIAAGPPSRIIEEAIDGRLELVLAQPVMDELKRVLTGKLRFDPEHWRQVEELLTDIATATTPPPKAAPEAITGDPDDDLILACAIEARVDVLVSGDRQHLLPVGTHQGIRIITPQALLAELRST
ncbi:MAG TPA: putative toxin-antitoxin system toxin component, PIN family [Solirubrobacterales bacterium]|nr:putative toxin-antitoxin system toxin component, PIN family [Solirubrobacterales bacterium]